MTTNGWLQIALFCAVVILITRPFGGYITRVVNGERTFLSPVLGPLERAIYAVCGVNQREDQHWVPYPVAMLAFSLAGFPLPSRLPRLHHPLPPHPPRPP